MRKGTGLRLFAAASMWACNIALATSCEPMIQAMKMQARQSASKGDVASELDYAALTGDAAGAKKAALMLAQNSAQRVNAQATLDKALYDAAMAGQVSSVRALAQSGANVKSPGDPPLIGAAQCGQIASMKELVSLGANVSQRAAGPNQANVPNTPLETALGGHEFKAASWLLSAHADTCSAEAQARLSRFAQSPAIKAGLSTRDLQSLECRS